MLRTRELVLFLTGVSFFLFAIALTLFFYSSGTVTSQSAALLLGISHTAQTYEAVIKSEGKEDAITTKDHLTMMRDKVVAYRADGGINKELFVVAEMPEEEMVVFEEVDDVSVASSRVQECSGYSIYVGAWPQRVHVEEREGARLVYTAGASTAAATSSDKVETVLLQLPVHTQPQLQRSCLPTDVVGVAQDGSLIRNNEHGLYSIFTDATIVGYALDGFPIYGKNNSVVVDECGGAVVGGQYGYVLQDDRAAIIHCFRGRPVNL